MVLRRAEKEPHNNMHMSLPALRWAEEKLSLNCLCLNAACAHLIGDGFGLCIHPPVQMLDCMRAGS